MWLITTNSHNHTTADGVPVRNARKHTQEAPRSPRGRKKGLLRCGRRCPLTICVPLQNKPATARSQTPLIIDRENSLRISGSMAGRMPPNISTQKCAIVSAVNWPICRALVALFNVASFQRAHHYFGVGAFSLPIIPLSMVPIRASVTPAPPVPTMTSGVILIWLVATSFIISSRAALSGPITPLMSL